MFSPTGTADSPHGKNSKAKAETHTLLAQYKTRNNYKKNIMCQAKDLTQDSAMPVSPVHPGSSSYSAATPYLPGYLLGDHQLQQPHGLSSPRLWSPGSSQSAMQRPGGITGSLPHSPSSSSLARRESTRARHGAPPVKSLYSSPPSADGNTSQLSLSHHNRSTSSPGLRSIPGAPVSVPTPSGLMYTPGGGSRGDISFLGSSFGPGIPASPAQSDPFYTQGDLKADDVLDETWVTVFGFPPGATSFILQQFAQYGTIIKHVVASECNWMHIHYQSKMQAKKALSKDGKVYGGCLKIGVTACIEKSVMMEEKDVAYLRGPRVTESSVMMEEKENQSILSPTATGDNSVMSSKMSNSSSLTPIRPLTAAYVASKGEYEILRDRHTPRRDSGVMSKLKEYMFGY